MAGFISGFLLSELLKGILSSSVKNINDKTLLLELARRGYDLSSLRENETAAEIVKIR